MVALSYGVAPATVLPQLLDITVEGTDLTHVLRAIMGLYLGMIVLWVLGAFRPSLTRVAVIAEIAFMSGLAVGRALSIIVDGIPSIALLGYTGVEIAMAGWGMLVLKKCFTAPHRRPTVPSIWTSASHGNESVSVPGVSRTHLRTHAADVVEVDVGRAGIGIPGCCRRRCRRYLKFPPLFPFFPWGEPACGRGLRERPPSSPPAPRAQ